MTIFRSKTSTFPLFEVTFLLEKWKLVCLISTFRVLRRSKSGWRKQDSVAEGHDGSHHPRYAEYNPVLTLSSIYTHLNKLKEKSYRKTLWKKVKLLKMSNFTFFYNVFYAICILKSFNSHISDVVCSFFEFGTASKWCIMEWVNNWRRKRGST